jgi:RNA polymerase sigma-70 factor, ECF subfamily
LLQNVVEEFPAPNLHTRERNVTGKSSPRDAFEELFLCHYSRVVALLRRIVGDPARAEDLASEAFLKLYRLPSPRNSMNNVAGWLYRTATNLGIDALRSSARRNRYEQAAARAEIQNPQVESALDAALRTETQKRVRAVLAEIKPIQAQLLLLRASGHSYKELADALEIDLGSVGTRLIRAEAAFEQRYLELYGREEKP